MNLHAYLRIGPDGRIDLPTEFREQLGLPEGPAYIEARLCVDGVIELGPVVPGELPPRKFGQHSGLVVSDTLDDPLSADEMKARDLEELTPEAWEGQRKFVDECLTTDAGHSAGDDETAGAPEQVKGDVYDDE